MLMSPKQPRYVGDKRERLYPPTDPTLCDPSFGSIPGSWWGISEGVRRSGSRGNGPRSESRENCEGKCQFADTKIHTPEFAATSEKEPMWLLPVVSTYNAWEGNETLENYPMHAREFALRLDVYTRLGE